MASKRVDALIVTPSPPAAPHLIMTTQQSIFFLLSYLLLDTPLTILLLGFFSSSWTFDFDLIFKYLLFVDGYSFLDNPMDFVLLSIIRSLLLVLAISLMAFHSSSSSTSNRQTIHRQLLTPVLLYSIFCYSYALTKLLVFAEKPQMLKYPGMWMTVAWAIVSAFMFVALWWLVLVKKNGTERYGVLNNESDGGVTSTRALLEETSGEGTTGSSEESTPQGRFGTFRHMLRLLAYCKDQWIWFSLGFVFLLIYACVRVFIPALMGDVISNIVHIKGFDVLVHSVLVMAALTFLSSFMSGLRGGCFDYATAKVSRQVRQDLFRSLVIQDISFFDVTKSGEIVSRLTSDCQTISSTVSTNINVFLRNGIMLVGALCYMFYLSWQLAMITLIAVPFVGCVTKLYGAYFDKLSEQMQDTISKANHVAEEVLSTMRTVRSFACELREAGRFDKNLDKTLKVSRKRAIAYTGFNWTNEVCDNCILVAVLFYGGHLVLSRQMSSSDLITFLLYQLQIGENLNSIGYVFTGLMESVGASRKVFEYMNRVPHIPLNGQQRPHVQGNIQFTDVCFTYPSRPNNPVLKNLNLTIGAGETVALVGPSGGGKSSIVAMIEHFYEPDSGFITLDGVNIRDIGHVYYHQRIALVAQEPVLYDGSVRYNILYGCDWATEEDMLAAAHMANVHQFVSELEKGYDTNCGDKGVQMSGGQKQRIAIARALVRKPAVLILDEATSALDAESEALVQDALNKCAVERTVLIIAHRLSTIEKADRICVIQKGSLVQSGSHNDLMQDKEGLYYALVKKQMLAAKVGEES